MVLPSSTFHNDISFFFFPSFSIPFSEMLETYSKISFPRHLHSPLQRNGLAITPNYFPSIPPLIFFFRPDRLQPTLNLNPFLLSVLPAAGSVFPLFTNIPCFIVSLRFFKHIFSFNHLLSSFFILVSLCLPLAVNLFYLSISPSPLLFLSLTCSLCLSFIQFPEFCIFPHFY